MTCLDKQCLQERCTLERMASKTSKPRQKRPLSHTRPRNFSKSHSLSSKTARALINKHHQLSKSLQRAKATGNTESAKALEAQLDDTGGLVAYQRASRIGQSKLRGGDSSKVLIEWLKERKKALAATDDHSAPPELTLLEIGALSCENACSTSGIFSGGVTRIDLHSTTPGVERQDFMKRPEPVSVDEQFDCVSLSLVLNYVTEPKERGDMLRRVVKFLRERDSGRQSDQEAPPSAVHGYFPCIFVVLPAPCVTNSRYLDDAKLIEILQALGCLCVCQKTSARLVYYLFKYSPKGKTTSERSIAKKQVRSGKDRNNFAITLATKNSKG